MLVALNMFINYHLFSLSFPVLLYYQEDPVHQEGHLYTDNHFLLVSLKHHDHQWYFSGLYVANYKWFQ